MDCVSVTSKLCVCVYVVCVCVRALLVPPIPCFNFKRVLQRDEID